MRRENRAAISDEALTGAFATGLNEGMRLVGYALLTIEVGGRRRMNEVLPLKDVAARVAGFFEGLRGEDYSFGVVVSAIPQDEPPPDRVEEQDQELAEGIEDAEIVEQ